MSKEKENIRAKARTKSRKDQNTKRLRTYSFVVTLVLIALILGVSYFGSLPTVDHIPSDFKFTPQPWMSVVPARIFYLGYVDIQGVIATTGNATFFGNSGLVDLNQLNFSILPQSVTYEIDIQLTDQNTAVTVLKLQQETFNTLVTLTSRANARSWQYGAFVVRALLMRTLDQQQQVLGYLSLANGYVLVSVDASTGLQQVETILSQIVYTVPSLFDNVTVQRAVYASGITSGPYLGLFLGMFSSQLSGSEMIVKSVTTMSGSTNTIMVTRSVLFRDPDAALSQYAQAQRIYRDASRYRILDAWLVIAYQYTTDKLHREIAGL